MFLPSLLFLCGAVCSMELPKTREEYIAKVIDSDLPRTVKPRLYELQLNLDMDMATENNELEWNGTVVIHLEKIDSSAMITEISMHKDKELTILEVEADNTEVTEWRILTGTPIMKIFLADSMKDSMTLTIRFKATEIGSNSYLSRGFFKASTEDGVQILSQNEMRGARRIFPCFDEPFFKAKFMVSVQTTAGYTVLSNSPQVRKETVERNQTITTFEETPLLPTYLLAIFITSQSAMEREQNGRRYRLFSPAKSRDDAKPYLPLFAKGMNVLSAELAAGDVELKKLDALDATLKLGFKAMENWGLQLYTRGFFHFSNDALLHGGVKSLAPNGVPELLLTINILYHELAHHWWGNIITPDASWNENWLKEGLPSQYSLLPLEKIHRLDRDATACYYYSWYSLDAPSLYNTTSFPHTYTKGASLFRMIEDYMGAEAYRRSMNEFIEDYAVSKLPFGYDLFEIWDRHFTKKMNGTPLERPGVIMYDQLTSSFPTTILVTKAAKDGCWTLSMVDRPERPSMVPVFLQDRHVILTQNASHEVCGEPYAPILNHNCRGYFKVLYDEAGKSSLVQSETDGADHMSDIDVFKVWGDAINPEQGQGRFWPTPSFYGSRANVMYGDLLNHYYVDATLDAYFQKSIEKEENIQLIQLICYAKKHQGWISWEIYEKILRHLMWIRSVSTNPAAYDEFLRKTYGFAYENGGWPRVYTTIEDVDFARSFVMARTTEAACIVGVKACTDQAQVAFENWIERDIDMPADLQGAIICQGLQQDKSEDMFRRVLKKLVDSDPTELKYTTNAVAALFCANSSFVENIPDRVPKGSYDTISEAIRAAGTLTLTGDTVDGYLQWLLKREAAGEYLYFYGNNVAHLARISLSIKTERLLTDVAEKAEVSESMRDFSDLKQLGRRLDGQYQRMLANC